MIFLRGISKEIYRDVAFIGIEREKSIHFHWLWKRTLVYMSWFSDSSSERTLFGIGRSSTFPVLIGDLMDYSTYAQVFEQLIDRINHPRDGLPPFSLEILRIRLLNEYFHPTYEINDREKWRLFILPKTEVPEFKLYHEFRPKYKWVHELYHIRYCVNTGCKNMVIRKRLMSQKRFPTKEGNVCDVCQKKTQAKSRRRVYEAYHEIHMEKSYQQQKQLYSKMSQIPPLIRKDCFTVQWYADMFEIEQSFTKSECYTKVKEELKRVMKLAYYKHPKKVIENYRRFYHIKPGVKFMVDGE